MKWIAILCLIVTGCTVPMKATVTTTSPDQALASLELEMALQEIFKASHKEEMDALKAQSEILERIESSVGSLASPDVPLEASETEKVENPVETSTIGDSPTVDGGIEPLTEDSESLKPLLPKEEPIQPDYLVVFTADWCGVCKQWKQFEEGKVKDADITIDYVNIDENPEYRPWVKRLPTFWRTDGKTRLKKRAWIEYQTAATLIEGFKDSPVTSTTTKVIYTAPTNRGCICGSNCGCDNCGCPKVTSMRSRLPVTNTQWGTIDLETYRNDGCNCPMCQGIRSLQNQYRQTLVAPPQEPTPVDTLSQMIGILNLSSSDTLADIGCGDGRVLIQATKRYGCEGVGVEIDEKKAEEARENVEKAGLSDKILIITGDALEFEPEAFGVTAVTAYLYPDLLEKIAPKLEEIKTVASPYHEIPGLAMRQVGNVWIKGGSNPQLITQPTMTYTPQYVTYRSPMRQIFRSRSCCGRGGCR